MLGTIITDLNTLYIVYLKYIFLLHIVYLKYKVSIYVAVQVQVQAVQVQGPLFFGAVMWTILSVSWINHKRKVFINT